MEIIVYKPVGSSINKFISVINDLSLKHKIVSYGYILKEVLDSWITMEKSIYISNPMFRKSFEFSAITDESEIVVILSSKISLDDITMYTISDKQKEILDYSVITNEPVILSTGVFPKYEEKDSLYPSTYHLIKQFLGNKADVINSVPFTFVSTNKDHFKGGEFLIFIDKGKAYCGMDFTKKEGGILIKELGENTFISSSKNIKEDDIPDSKRKYFVNKLPKSYKKEKSNEKEDNTHHTNRAESWNKEYEYDDIHEGYLPVVKNDHILTKDNFKHYYAVELHGTFSHTWKILDINPYTVKISRKSDEMDVIRHIDVDDFYSWYKLVPCLSIAKKQDGLRLLRSVPVSRNFKKKMYSLYHLARYGDKKTIKIKRLNEEVPIESVEEYLKETGMLTTETTNV